MEACYLCTELLTKSIIVYFSVVYADIDEQLIGHPNNLTEPIGFSCVYAHVVSKMADVAITSARRENNFSLILEVNYFKEVNCQLYIDNIECCCVKVIAPQP